MNLVEVKVVGLQAAQAGLAALNDVLTAEALIVRPLAMGNRTLVSSSARWR